MLQRFSRWLYQVSSGRVTLLALVVFLLFSALVLPAQGAAARQDSGDAGSPDTSLFYSADDLYRLAEAYGLSGRQAYIRARFTFDVAWPLVYAFFLVTATSWLLDRALDPSSRWRLANLVPLIAALFDFLENVSTSLVMARYPNPTAVLDALAPWFTLIKWILVGGSFLLLALGLVAVGWQWMQSRR